MKISELPSLYHRKKFLKHISGFENGRITINPIKKPLMEKQTISIDGFHSNNHHWLINMKDRVFYLKYMHVSPTSHHGFENGNFPKPAGTGHRSQVIVLPIQKVSQTPLKANLRPNKFLFRPN